MTALECSGELLAEAGRTLARLFLGSRSGKLDGETAFRAAGRNWICRTGLRGSDFQRLGSRSRGLVARCAGGNLQSARRVAISRRSLIGILIGRDLRLGVVTTRATASASRLSPSPRRVRAAEPPRPPAACRW